MMLVHVYICGLIFLLLNCCNHRSAAVNHWINVEGTITAQVLVGSGRLFEYQYFRSQGFHVMKMLSLKHEIFAKRLGGKYLAVVQTALQTLE